MDQQNKEQGWSNMGVWILNQFKKKNLFLFEMEIFSDTQVLKEKKENPHKQTKHKYYTWSFI